MDSSDVRPIAAPRADGDERRAFLITVASDGSDDYAGQYIVNVNANVKRRFERVLTALAQELRTPVLAGAGDLLMCLSLPDGTVHRLHVEQDEDGGIRNTPEMRPLIAAHTPPRAVASQVPFLPAQTLPARTKSVPAFGVIAR